MLAFLLIAVLQNPTIAAVEPGVYDACRLLRNERDVGEAPDSADLIIHEIQNYTFGQVTGRFEGRPGQKVHWLSGPLAGQIDATYIARPNQPPRLRFQAQLPDGAKADYLCTKTQD